MKLRCLAVLRSSPIQKLFSLVVLALLVLMVHAGSAPAQETAKMGRKVVARVEPAYPDFFRNGHFQVRIVAAATVLPNGDVSNVEIKGGNPMFANYAAKALKKWKYAPGPNQTVEEVTFNFTSDPR